MPPRLSRSPLLFEKRYITDFRPDTRPRSGVGLHALVGRQLVTTLGRLTLSLADPPGVGV
jgi:hypothetical protein